MLEVGSAAALMEVWETELAAKDGSSSNRRFGSPIPSVKLLSGHELWKDVDDAWPLCRGEEVFEVEAMLAIWLELDPRKVDCGVKHIGTR